MMGSDGKLHTGNVDGRWSKGDPALEGRPGVLSEMVACKLSLKKEEELPRDGIL